MADTTALKNRIRAAVKANDNQEITGPVLQQALLDIVDELNGATETEASQRQNGDSTLQQGINTERQARIDADDALSQRITEEVNTRQNGDSALQNAVSKINNKINKSSLTLNFNDSYTSSVSSFYIEQGKTYILNLTSKGSVTGDIYCKINTIITSIGYLRVNTPVELTAPESGYLMAYCPNKVTGNITIEAALNDNLQAQINVINSNIQGINSDIQGINSDIQDVNSDITSINSEINSLKDKTNTELPRDIQINASKVNNKISKSTLELSFNDSYNSSISSFYIEQEKTYKVTLKSKDGVTGDVYLKIISAVTSIGYLRVNTPVEFIAPESGFASFYCVNKVTGSVSADLALDNNLQEQIDDLSSAQQQTTSDVNTAKADIDNLKTEAYVNLPLKINSTDISITKTAIPFVFNDASTSNSPISVKAGNKYTFNLIDRGGLSGDYYIKFNNSVVTSIGYLTTEKFTEYTPETDGNISLYVNGKKTGTVTVSVDCNKNVFNVLERKNYKVIESFRLTRGVYNLADGTVNRATNNDPIYNGSRLGMLKRWARTFDIVYIEKDSYVVNDSATIYSMRVCKYNTKDESSFVSGSTVQMTSKKMHTFTETGYYSLSFERANSTNFDLDEINTNFRFHIMTNFDEIGVFAAFIGCGMANGASPIYGDCTLFITPNGKSILIDMGTPAAEVGNIRRWLFNYGVIKIDYAIISHYHEDHAGGIWQEINTNKTIDFSNTTFFLPDNAAAAYAFEHAEEYHLGVGSINAYNGLMEWLNSENFLEQKIYPTASACDYDADGVSLHFWNTDHSVYSLPGDDNYNDYSLCCDVCFGSQKIGMTGDLGPIGERTTKDDVYKVNLMKAQHHGYEHDPMNVDWINHICPDIVVSEDWAEHNTYILTKDAPLQSWCEANGVPNYRVAINTGIEVYIFKESLQMFNVVQKYIRGDSNWSVPYGDTAGRPYQSNMRIGTMYFDQTLGKPIYWNGNNWVDSNGTTI